MNDHLPPTEQVYSSSSDQEFRLHSSSFKEGSPLGKEFSCEGENKTPFLQWTGVPRGTEAFALIVDDPDAPTAQPWVHWVVANIPSTVQELTSLGRERTTAQGILQGTNSFHRIGFDGPCPPPGPAHRYYFTLYALRKALQLPDPLTKESLLHAMEGAILGKAVLMGTYKRSS